MKIIFDVCAVKSFFYVGQKKDLCTLITEGFVDDNRKIDLFRKDKLSLSAANNIGIYKRDSVKKVSKISLYPINVSLFEDHLQGQCEKIMCDFVSCLSNFAQSIQYDELLLSKFNSKNRSFEKFLEDCKEQEVKGNLDSFVASNAKSIKNGLNEATGYGLPPRFQEKLKNLKKAAKRYFDALSILNIIKNEKQKILLTIAVGDFQILSVMLQIENSIRTISGALSNFKINKDILSSSKTISSVSDTLHSIFSVMDLNLFFKIGEHSPLAAADLPKNKKNKIRILQVPTDISKAVFALQETSYAAYGSIFIKAIEERKDSDKGKLIFDSVCLLTSFGRKETSKTLFDYAYARERKELGKTQFLKEEIGIEDFATGTSKHLFYNDGLFVYGVMNPLSDIEWEKKITRNKGGGFIHMIRYQGEHDFNVLLSSLMYSSMVILSHDKIDDIFNKKFNEKADFFARLSKIRSSAKTMSKMRLLYNSDSIFVKPYDRELCKTVSRHVDLEFFEQQSSEKTEMIWQEGNLNTGKKYGYISALLASIALLFTGILSLVQSSSPSWFVAGIVEICVSAIILILFIVLWLIDLVWWLRPRIKTNTK